MFSAEDARRKSKDAALSSRQKSELADLIKNILGSVKVATEDNDFKTEVLMNDYSFKVREKAINRVESLGYKVKNISNPGHSLHKRYEISWYN